MQFNHENECVAKELFIAFLQSYLVFIWKHLAQRGHSNQKGFPSDNLKYLSSKSLKIFISCYERLYQISQESIKSKIEWEIF